MCSMLSLNTGLLLLFFSTHEEEKKHLCWSWGWFHTVYYWKIFCILCSFALLSWAQSTVLEANLKQTGRFQPGINSSLSSATHLTGIIRIKHTFNKVCEGGGGEGMGEWQTDIHTYRQTDRQAVMKTVLSLGRSSTLQVCMLAATSVPLSPHTVSAACNYLVPCHNVFSWWVLESYTHIQ